MAYKIKVTNKFGTYYSRGFSNQKEAMRILKENKVADKNLNKMGYKNIVGKPIKMNNKYKLVRE